MQPPRKRRTYLDYPLFPQRRRPRGWPVLALGGLGLLVFFGWAWLARPPGAPSGPTPTATASQPLALAPTTPVIPTATRPVTPTATALPSPTRPRVTPRPATQTPAVLETSELIDEVNEVEATWADHAGRTELITYTVQDGDTLWSIADQFTLDVDTLRWSNPDLERNPDMLSVGMELVILPVVGVYHTVQAGDTLGDIAQRYGVAESDILNFPLNGLTDPDNLRQGQKLIIPHGRRDLDRPTPQPSPASPFAWPLVGAITQGFGDAHQGIDIGAPYGSAVYAARGGQVIRVGWARTGYGYTVIIDHGDGLQSLYSHMKGPWVQVGDQVERGQLIGEVGSTGNSSGPHVHFEVRVAGQAMDPKGYLPAGEPR